MFIKGILRPFLSIMISFSLIFHPLQVQAVYYHMSWEKEKPSRLVIRKVSAQSESTVEEDKITEIKENLSLLLSQEKTNESVQKLLDDLKQPEELIKNQPQQFPPQNSDPVFKDIQNLRTRISQTLLHLSLSSFKEDIKQNLCQLEDYYSSFIDHLLAPTCTADSWKQICQPRIFFSSSQVGYFKMLPQAAQELIQKSQSSSTEKGTFRSPQDLLDHFLFGSHKSAYGTFRRAETIPFLKEDVTLPLDEKGVIEKSISFQQFLAKIDKATPEKKEKLYESLSFSSFTRAFIVSFLTEPLSPQLPPLEIHYNTRGKGFFEFASYKKPSHKEVLENSRPETGASLQEKNLIPLYGFKNPLYLLAALMEKRVPLEVREVFLDRPPELGILQYGHFLEQGKKQEENTYPSPLPLGIRRLGDRWLELSASLKDHPYTRLKNILKSLHPLVFYYFQDKLDHHSNNLVKLYDHILTYEPRLESLYKRFPSLSPLEQMGKVYGAPGVVISQVESLQLFIDRCDLNWYLPHHVDKIYELLRWVSQYLPQEKGRPQRHKSWQDPLVWKQVLDYKGEGIIEQASRLGIDPNKIEGKADITQTRLHTVIQKAEQEASILPLIEELLKTKADPDALNSAGKTPLDLAHKKEFSQVVAALIRSGGGCKLNNKNAFQFYKTHDLKESLRLLQKRNQHFAWEYLWDSWPSSLHQEKISDPLKEGLPIETIHFGKKVLPPELVAQAFQKDAKDPSQIKLKPTEKFGNSAVAKVMWKGLPVYFKESPAFPGLEYMVSQLELTMSGGSVPLSEFVLIDGMPYLISQGIEGKNLRPVIDKDPSLKTITWDEEALYHKLILSMVTFPEDGRADNYVVQPCPDKPGKKRLVSVDNDQAFVPGIAKEKIGTASQNVIQVKCIPFCFPEMHKPIPRAVRDHFANQEPYGILSELLKKAENYHKSVIALKENAHKPSFLTLTHSGKPTYYGIPFVKNTLGRLYERMKTIHKTLGDLKNSNIAPYQLLEEVDWLLAQKYRPQNESVKNRFSRIETTAQNTQSSTAHRAILKGLEIPEVQNLGQTLKKKEEIGPSQALREMLDKANDVAWKDIAPSVQVFKELLTADQRAQFIREKINGSQLNEPELKRWMKVISETDTPDLTLSGNSVLTTRSLISHGNFFLNLQKLTLSKCINLDADNLVFYLADQCKGLQSLDLSETKITGFDKPYHYPGGVRSFILRKRQEIAFPFLRCLILNQCAQLKTITLMAPLERLEVQQCGRLSTPSLKKDATNELLPLQRLAAEGTVQFSSDWINSWIQQGTKVTLDARTAKGDYARVLEKIPPYPNWREEKLVIKIEWTEKGSDFLIDLKAVLSLSSLTSLDLAHSYVEADGVKVLSSHKNITSLNVSYNNIGLQEAQELIANMRLRTLNLRRNNLGIITKEFFMSSTLTNLNLSYTSWGYKEVFDGTERGARGTERPKYKTVEAKKHLSIKNDVIQELCKNTILTSLNIRENYIIGIKRFLDIIKKNTTLTSLNLQHNKIGNRGAGAFTENTTLTSLDLSDNNIEDYGAEELAKNTTLTSLNLEGNHLGDRGKKAIQEMLARNKKRAEEKKSDFPSFTVPLQQPSSAPSSSFPLPQSEEDSSSRKRSSAVDWLYMGLSIDGGGMRGLTPAIMQNHLSKVSQKPLYKIFDYMGGTSVGGILSLGNVATEDGITPLCSPQQLVKLFSEHGTRIFPPQGIMEKLKNPVGLRHSLYDPAPLETLLKGYFKDCTLKNVLTNVLVTGVIHGTNQPFLFDSGRAILDDSQDFLLRFVARGTSAAPTYFPSALIWNVKGNKNYIINDGGVGMNDPTSFIGTRLSRMAEDRHLNRDHFFVLSLGTGDLKNPYAPAVDAGLPGWLFKGGGGAIINAAMDAPMHFTRQFISEHFQGNYVRFQPILYWDWSDPRQDPSQNSRPVLINEAPLDKADPKYLQLYSVAAKHAAIKAFGEKENPTPFVRWLQENTDRKHLADLGFSSRNPDFKKAKVPFKLTQQEKSKEKEDEDSFMVSSLPSSQKDKITSWQRTYYTDADITEYVDSTLKHHPSFTYGLDHKYLLTQRGDSFKTLPDSEDGLSYIVAVTPAINKGGENNKQNFSKGFDVSSSNIDYHFDKSTHPFDVNEDVLQIINQGKAAGKSDSEILSEIREKKGNLDMLKESIPSLQERLYKEVCAFQKAKRDVFEEIMPEVMKEENGHVKILFPYNLDESHWLTGEIRLHKTNNTYKVEIFAHDPMGGGDIDEGNFKILEKSIQKRIKAYHSKAIFTFERKSSPYSRRQAEEDGFSCGVIVAEDFLQRIDGPIKKIVYPVGAEDLRNRHIETIRKNDPTLAFVQRNEPKLKFIQENTEK